MSTSRMRQPSAKPKSAPPLTPRLARAKLPKKARLESPSVALIDGADCVKIELLGCDGRFEISYEVTGSVVGDAALPAIMDMLGRLHSRRNGGDQ